MPQRKTEFVNDEIYHVVVRRIGDELLFMDTDDYYRGIFSIYEFNTSKPIEIYAQRRARQVRKKDTGGPTSFIDNREKLVEILAFSLMPNHVHLLLRQLIDRGITTFIRKIGSGYPIYFRRKHHQTGKGYFFQGKFTSVHIKSDDQLITVLTYIHTNPLSLIELKWKEGIVRNSQKAIEFLENYKWSSYQDYLGKKNFPSVTDRDFMLEVIGGEKAIKKTVNDWVRHKREIKGIDEIALE
ncbi:MAG: transposase [bacterium]|nr:transposase [bacterium]